MKSRSIVNNASYISHVEIVTKGQEKCDMPLLPLYDTISRIGAYADRRFNIEIACNSVRCNKGTDVTECPIMNVLCVYIWYNPYLGKGEFW